MVDRTTIDYLTNPGTDAVDLNTALRSAISLTPGVGDMLKLDNLAGLASAPVALTNIGALGKASNLSDVASVIAAHDSIITAGADIASAATIDLDAATGVLIDVTGTTTITSITLSSGRERMLRCLAALPITASATLIVNKTTSGTSTFAADDLLYVTGHAAGVVRVHQQSLPMSYTPVNKAGDFMTGDLALQLGAIISNNQSLRARDKNSNVLSLLSVDTSSTIQEGPGNDKLHHYINYTLKDTENQRLMWHGRQGVLPVGMVETAIGGGFTRTIDNGRIQYNTGAISGDGVRIDFGGIAWTMEARSLFEVMVNAYSNLNIDLKFGLASKTTGATIFTRYSSAGTSDLFKFTTDNGSGTITTTNSAEGDATFSRQMKILAPNSYGTGVPSPVSFMLSDANNEYSLATEVIHSDASLPGVAELLYPFMEFRTSAAAVATMSFRYAAVIFER